MRNLLRALVLAACMLPGVAAAQCNISAPLPTNSVVGRLGIGPGPCQAIPFSVLLANVGSVPLARNINTTSPLAGGGNLGSDRTLSLNIGVGLATSGGNLVLANPSASTIGGVESIAATAHQWINTISTSGVPSSSQPAFTDISGQWTLTQGPTMGANTVLGSVAGGTPIALTQAQITAMINAATASLPGALPAWPNNTTTFFRGDGTYQNLNFAAVGGTISAGQFSTGPGILTLSMLANAAAGTIASNSGSVSAPLAATSQPIIATSANPGVITAGFMALWMDSTDLRLHDRGNAGTIGTTVVSSTAGANQFATGISAAGVIGYAQPSVSNLAGFGAGNATILGVANGSAGGPVKLTATGTIALGTSAISANTCSTAATSSASGVATTDVIDIGFSGDPSATTGYTPTAMLTLVVYPTANTVNVKQCNLTGSSITPSALTLNYAVRR